MSTPHPRMVAVGVLSLMLMSGLAAHAQERWFYHGRDDGSEAMYNPVNLLLNGSFDIIQLDGYSRAIGRYSWSRLTNQVLYNMARPIQAIESYGTGEFINTQVLPFDVTRKGAQWWPNYQLHLVGGGMTFVAMREWYEEHGFAAPAWCSLGTMAAYHFLNEVVESNKPDDIPLMPFLNADPIADLYLFDIAGIVLFSFDSVSAFFSRTMNLADWSLQPSFTFSPLALQNNGQYFSVKWRIPYLDHWHLFYITGMNGLVGLSYKDDRDRALSLGLGMRARRLEQVRDGVVRQTADLVWNAGLFLDDRNNLLASLMVGGLTSNMITLNIYPGLLRVAGVSPGVWLTMDRDRHIMGGIVTRFLPGVALK